MSKIYTAYEGLPNLPRGEDHPKTKLSEKIVIQIRKYHARGWTMVRLGEKYGVTPQAISKILKGITWKHI